MDLDGEKKMICRVCSAPADKGCSSCNRVNYCCKDHQVEDWKLRHRNECYVVQQENEKIGRFYVAQRDIPAGTIIFDEQATLVQPGLSKSNLVLKFIKDLECSAVGNGGTGVAAAAGSNSSNVKMSNICLGCSKENCTGICSRCSWPVCNDKCMKVSHHADYECKLFQAKSVKFNGHFNCTMSTAIFVIRGILMKKVNPSKWTDLQHLIQKVVDKEYPPDISQKDRFKELRKTILPYFKKLNISEEFTNIERLKEISYLAGYRDFCLVNQTPIGDGLTLSEAIYPKSSLLANGCFANCSSVLGPGPKIRKVTWTNIDIAKGEMLTVSYDHDFSKKGAGQCERIRSGFTCFCSRCLDPTESGTMMSAIKCSCGGYLLPLDHHDMSLDAKWTCKNCRQNTTTWSQVNELIDTNYQKMKDFIGKFNDFELVEEFIQNLHKLFHPNHWIIMAFIDGFTMVCESCLEEEMDTINKWSTYINKMEYMGRIYASIYPGLSDGKLEHLKNIMRGYKIYKKLIHHTIAENGHTVDQVEVDVLTIEIVRVNQQLRIVIQDLLKIAKLHLLFKNPPGEELIKNLEIDLCLLEIEIERSEEYESEPEEDESEPEESEPESDISEEYEDLNDE